MYSGIARPAGQAQVPQTASAPEVSVGPDGRVSGIDGMLDQVAQSLVRQAYPAFREDHATQRRVGAAAGRAAADSLRPWIVLGSVALAAIAVHQIWGRRK